MSFLVDTSVWILALGKPARVDVQDYAPIEHIYTCLPVIQEVLQGIRDERYYQPIRVSMKAFPCVESPLTEAVFEEAAELYRAARRAGFTVRSSVDCLIAACAIRNGLTVLHDDRDFAALTRVSTLDQFQVRRI